MHTWKRLPEAWSVLPPFLDQVQKPGLAVSIQLGQASYLALGKTIQLDQIFPFQEGQSVETHHHCWHQTLLSQWFQVTKNQQETLPVPTKTAQQPHQASVRYRLAHGVLLQSLYI
jgi:hypothetical protein